MSQAGVRRMKHSAGDVRTRKLPSGELACDSCASVFGKGEVQAGSVCMRLEAAVLSDGHVGQVGAGTFLVA